MVRNIDLAETSMATKLIAETVKSLMVDGGWSQAKVGYLLGKSQSYVSLRVKGIASWTIDDLDKLAKAFGYANAFGLLDAVRGVGGKE